MHLASAKSLYEQLALASKGRNADSLWALILPRYFRPQDGFSVHDDEPLPRPAAEKSKDSVAEKSKASSAGKNKAVGKGKAKLAKSDFSIRVVKLSKQIRLVLLEDKRNDYERECAIWQQGRDHAAETLLALRKRQDKDLVLFAIVNIGRCSHFYELRPQSVEPDDLDETDALEYDFRENEECIDYFLCEITKRLM